MVQHGPASFSFIMTYDATKDGKQGIIYIDETNSDLYLWDGVSAYFKVGSHYTTLMENRYEIKQIWEDITGNPSGTLTTYANLEIVQEDWNDSENAIVVEVVGGKPQDQSVVDSSGDIVLVSSLASNGAYTLSGTPTASNYAMVYELRGKAVDFAIAAIPSANIVESYDLENPWFRNGTTISQKVDGDTIDVTNAPITNVGLIDFYLTAVTAIQEGRLQWDDIAGTLVLGMPGGNVMLQIGQELHIPRRVKNTSGVDIKNGDVIYINGGSGVNSFIAWADATDISKADRTIAIATEDIDINAFGYCTKFGLVKGETAQPIDTSIGVAGDVLYLDPANPGKFTTTKPEAPNRVVRIGNIFTAHATEGIIVAAIDIDKVQMVIDVTREPTGFDAPENVIVTGDSATRTVTLTGSNWNAYYRGDPYYTITSGWTSTAHGTDTSKAYLLYYDGSTTAWYDSSTLSETHFSNLLIAYAFYNSTDAVWVYQRECHGLMPHLSHREFHNTIGTFRKSGGTLADYVLNSTTAADRRPSISAALIYDEDLPTTNASLSAGTYTQFYLSGAGAEPNFITTGTDIVPLSGGAQPYYNQFTGGAWQQTLMSNNYYMAVWVVAVPMAADTNSQKLRWNFIQGQQQSLNLADIQALTTNDVNIGTLQELSPESVFTTKIIIQYTAADFKIIEVNDLTGNRISQGLSPTGLYLSSVTSDSTLTGIGTSGSPLSVNKLIDTDTKTADYTLANTDVGKTIIMNGSYNFTVPLNATVSIDVGFHCYVCKQSGSSEVAVLRGDSGVSTYFGGITDDTLVLSGSAYQKFKLEKIGTDSWIYTKEANTNNVISRTITSATNSLSYDIGNTVEVDASSGNVTYTIVNQISMKANKGDKIKFIKTGSYDATIAAGSGVTFEGKLGDVDYNIDGEDGSYAVFECVDPSTYTWRATENVKAV